MKIYKQIAGLVLIATIISCSNQNGDPTNSNAPQYFKTEREAVLKGKNDLLSVIRSTSGFQLTVNTELLQKSHPGITVKHVEVDFDQLLKVETLNNLNQLRSNAKSNINTLMVDNNVVTVIQTANSEKGWAVTGLADAALATDLDEVLSSQANSKIEEVTLYEIPTIQALVYQVKTEDGETYFSGYDGFIIKEGNSIQQLYPVLHGDALSFERKFGEEIKANRLVK